MQNSTYRIHFENATSDTANALSADLAEFLRDAVPDPEQLKLDRERTRADAQDFGATLVLILGSGAAVAVARGLQAWLARTGTSIVLEDGDGKVVASNVDANSAAEIVKAWKQRETGH